MNRELVKTNDNSTTLFVPELNQHYHSMRGAVQESQHVFIDAGLKPLLGAHDEINIFEMGLGTGLNALMTLQEAEKNQQKINYAALEKFPLNLSEAEQLGYQTNSSPEKENQNLMALHSCPWEKGNAMGNYFTFTKFQSDLRLFKFPSQFHLIYYDAFAPSAQPELWTEEVFAKLFEAMHPNGVLVTYCVKGDVRRAMKAVGFQVEKIPGPPGKREMARAYKLT